MATVAIIVAIIRDIIVIAAILSGVVVGVFVLKRWTPNIRLGIDPWWLDVDKGIIVLRLTVENISSVFVEKDRIALQVLPYKIEQQTHLSEWVPFTKKAIKPGEQPIEWHEPENILETTKGLYPGERITVDRMLTVQKDIFLHAALQHTARMSGIKRFLNGLLRWNEQWTITTIIAGNLRQSSPPR
jgi:hypothetical protein